MCNQCENQFKPENDLEFHMENAHCEQVSYFKCNQCNSEFENKNGLNCHIGNMHKVTLSPIPQVDANSEHSEVTIQLDQTMDELVHKLYDKPPASVIHPVRGRGFYHDTEPDSIYCYKFGDGKVYEC